MDKRRQELLQYIKEKAIQTRNEQDETPFVLSSGKRSYFYYNMKNVTLDPEASHLIAEIMLEKILGMGARSVGGLETGSVPIATSIMMKSKGTGHTIPAFFVRKKRKEHGDESEVEGRPVSPVIIVDDVTTKGESAMRAVEKIQALGYTVIAVLTIVDRESGANDLFKNKRLELIPIFKHSDFKNYIDEQTTMKIKKMKEVRTESLTVQKAEYRV
jgi:orotate phosphoribosyltransferase